MQRKENGKLVYYQFEQWAGLSHGIFTRHGGVSENHLNSLNLGGNVGDDPLAVRTNHERMYDALGVDEARACSVWQVHGTDVLMATKPVQGRRWITTADALITDQADTPLSMRFADCTPILFFDSVQGVIGIAHAGWRGTVNGMARKTVQAMGKAYGSKPENIQAAIGPSIGPEKYQVGDDVVQAVNAYFGDDHSLIKWNVDDHSAYFNLWEANRLDLQRAGVEQIEVAAICTAQNTQDWFSHREERGKTGRFGAVITRTS